MRKLFEAQGLSIAFGEKVIIEDGQLTVEQGDRIGLCGGNGAGKTTLLRLLLGKMEADSGKIRAFPETLNIGYLPQSLEMKGLGRIEDYGKLLQELSRFGMEHEISWEKENIHTLSGGEKLKLALATVMAKNPSLLLLDEPTNHLDARGMEWLAKVLRSFEGAVVLISHDRRFLDQTVNCVLELENGRLTSYQGNYSEYRKEKERKRDALAKAYDKQQRKIRTIEEQVERLSQWSDKAHREAGKRKSETDSRQMGLKEYDGVRAKKKDKQIKSKMRRLETELEKEQVEKPGEDSTVSFQFQPTRQRGKRVVEAKGIAKSFRDRVLFAKSHFYVKHGEKVGLHGVNGVGKTTLIRMLLGEEAITKGSLWKSPSLNIGYLKQDRDDLPLDQTALEYLNVAREEMALVRTMLANMNIAAKELEQPLRTFSQGERTKVKLVAMIRKDYDVLILDEPTNHLDLPSREQLEETLAQYKGTLLVVSHDRYFVDKLCDKLLVIEKQRIKRVESGLSEFEERRTQQIDPAKKDREDESALREMKMSELLGRLSLTEPGSPEYERLNDELEQFMREAKHN
ncbi:ribosomal protection-like ABC-F family protein [Shouchella shacheensis]|uniref:ribosomal protection-like ABC-F family protein n=1 Tax=Shouchella shacheensis TaxID=1649580 RepID=UPI0007404C68|nr:ABC-F type ribosomal protection protein [Shouchella shacheensis]